MVKKFRVVDLRAAGTVEFEVLASTPEDAGRQALHEEVVSSGRIWDLRAKVYFANPNQLPHMVRLYSKVVA